jgi:hypothetical protein
MAMRRLAFPILTLIGFTFLHVSVGAGAAENPFAYCVGIGTIDTPIGGGSPVPAALLPYLRTAIGLSADAPLTRQSYYWRCMDGAVFVCAIGASIPCDAKADRAKRNSGAEYYCRENPNAPFVPAYAAGHSGIYEWTCSAGRAIRGKVLLTLDHRGYPVDFWHRLSPAVRAELDNR